MSLIILLSHETSGSARFFDYGRVVRVDLDVAFVLHLFGVLHNFILL